MTAKICWDEQRVRRFLDADALNVENHVFLATHSPTKMFCKTSSQGEGVPYTEVDLLRDFLSPDEYMLVAVLGQSGTGKTHLVRWLAAQIPTTNQRKVLLVPRVTSLKRIIELILDGMDASKFDIYRKKLQAAADHLSPREARELLLSQLAIAIGPNGPHLKHNLSNVEEYLADNLHFLFHDPYFREILLKDNGKIHILADHVFGQGSVTRRNSRVEFELADLPVKLNDIQKASQLARDVYMALVSNEMIKQEAVKWINRHLDAAIAKMLNFQGNDLIELMNNVREELANQETELVLLIEDFAAIQGIDRQLLDALLIRPNQQERRLSPLRVVLACTTGYFNTLPDTVQTRVNFTVNLDLKAGEDMSNEDILSFVARYLNAARMDENLIKDWYQQRLVDSTIPIPSACTQCELREKCHSGFGAQNQMGLYPFNAEAIQVMNSRLNDKGSEFNPRRIVQQILRHTLLNYSDHIRDNKFPSPGMLEHFGGRTKNRLSALTVNDLKQKDPVNFERREVLIELWSTAGSAVNLSSFVHESFALPSLSEIGGSTQKPKVQEPIKDTKTKEPVDKDLEKLEGLIGEINDWRNGGALSQGLSQTLRESLWTSINSYIDWDVQPMSLSWLRNQGVWTQRRITFLNQSTRESFSSGGIRLSIPLENDDVGAVAIALQGILYYRHYKHWNFPGGYEYFRYFAEYLERWSTYVADQLRKRANFNNDVSIVDVGVFLLTVRALMRGHDVYRIDGVEQLEVLLDRRPLKYLREGQWGKIYTLIDTNLEKIETALLNVVNASKGESSHVKMLNSADLQRSLNNILLKGTTLDLDVTNVPPEFNDVLKIYNGASDTLHQLIEDERKEKISLYRQLVAEFGENVDKRVLLDTVKHAITVLHKDFGIASGMYESLNQSISSLERASLTTTMKELEKVCNGWESIKTILMKLRALGKLPVGDIFVVTNFIVTVGGFLTQTVERVRRDLEQLRGEDGIVSVEVVRDEINHLLNSLETTVKGEGESA